jgi:hypothetical protein
MRERAARQNQAATLALVASGIEAIDDAPVRLGVQGAAALPWGHVAALAEAVSSLLAPSRDAAKN